MARCGCSSSAPEQGFIKKKLPMVKTIFTISSVVELKNTDAIFSYLKHHSIGAFLGCVPFICCSVREF
jgi:hypothetical protein